MLDKDPRLALRVRDRDRVPLLTPTHQPIQERKRDTGARMDALLRGADWAHWGTNGESATGDALTETLASHAKVAD